MQFRSLIFPAPNPPSYSHDKLLGDLLYIPRNFEEQEIKLKKPPCKAEITTGVSSHTSP